MTFLRILIVACTVGASVQPLAMASPAKFWLSYSSADPDGLEAPAITGVENTTRYLHIWAQPATVNPAADYNVNTNRFKTVQNFSLNLATDVPTDNSDPICDFLDDTFTVYNPILDGKPRFQFIFDSHTTGGALTSTGESLDGVKGLQGFSIFPTNGNGIGHSAVHTTVGCHPDDPYCAPTHDLQQSPAWLIASVGVKMLASIGQSKLHLQIGQNGMTTQVPLGQIPDVVFGLNTPAPGPTYDSSMVSNRETTDPLDNPDATFSAISAGQVQLSTWNGATGLWINNSWTGGIPLSFDRSARLPASLGSNVVTVSGKQRAHETMVDGGRLHIAEDASLASKVIVAPTGAISGQGWVGSDLTLQPGATLTVAGLQPLLVSGAADVTNAVIRLGGNFAGSGPGPFEILRAFGGIQGSFAPSVGQNLGGGLFVGAINTVGNSIFLQLSGVAGDYNGNNVVDASDYVVWRNSVGCTTTICMSADGTHNGVVDQADYNVWRAHFGQTAGSGSSATRSASAVVPEPAITEILLLIVAHIFLFRDGVRCWHLKTRLCERHRKNPLLS